MMEIGVCSMIGQITIIVDASSIQYVIQSSHFHACAYDVGYHVQDRPVGWVKSDLVEKRPSEIAGTGLFAK